MKKQVLLVPVLVLLLASCHPDGPINNYSTVTQVNYFPFILPNIAQISQLIPIPAGASGALYAVNSICASDTNPGFIPSGGYAFAWFGNDTNSKNAGLVMAGSDSVKYPYYFSDFIADGSSVPPIFPSNTISWNVQGNDTSGISALSYNDNTSFPVVNGLTVPKTFTVANGLTLHYTISGTYDARYYEIIANGSQTYYSGGSDTSASFSTTQLYTLFPTKGQLISAAIILAKLTPYTTGNQTFYFVKVSIYSATMTAQ